MKKKPPTVWDNEWPSRNAIIRPLLRWFRANARDLPWRRTADPYAIWISEIMLQQTQVDTAKPYYLKFMKRFPTVQKLARTRIDTVMKQWEGLGYYARARNMHEAARQIVRHFNGQLPREKEGLLSLPGIGPYTAGAIASIAFGCREPVVDGNVARVLCRLLRITENPKRSPTKRRIWLVAEELLPASSPGDFNQALMELGAGVCSPANPHCCDCPLGRICLANIHQEQAILPVRDRSQPIPFYNVAIGVIFKKGHVLIDKRPPEGLLGGLWEFPGGKVQPGESPQDALRREIHEELGIEIRLIRQLAIVGHAYTHFRVRLHAFECVHVRGKPRCGNCTAVKWVLPEVLDRFAFPAANKRIINILRQEAR